MKNGRIESFAKRLRDGLEIRGMKPIDLSKKTGISESSISQWLKGTHEAKQTGVYKAAIALEVHVAWLMGYDVTMDGVAVGARSDDLTLPEYTHIKKYRVCDDDGKTHVDYILDREYSRALKK